MQTEVNDLHPKPTADHPDLGETYEWHWHSASRSLKSFLHAAKYSLSIDSQPKV